MFTRIIPLVLLSALAQAHAQSWEKLPPLPAPASGFAAGCVNGRIIVAGGTNWRDGVKQFLDTVWRFDPATLKWETGPKLPHPVAYVSFASDGARLFFAGGTDGKQGRREVYALDDDLKLTQVGELPEPVIYGGGAIRDGHLYVFGGTPHPDDWSKGGNRLHRVSLASGNAETLPPLSAHPHPVGIPTVFALGPNLYTVTGAWIDPALQAHNVREGFKFGDAWSPISPYPRSNRGVSPVALDENRVYLGGGYGTDAEGFVAHAFIYDWQANRFAPSVPLPLSAMTALVKCGDYVYQLGGEDLKKHRTDVVHRIAIEAVK